MYFADLDTYHYDIPRRLERVFHVGWLDPAHAFPVGKVEDALVTKLAELAAAQPVHRMRGWHECLFCPRLPVDALGFPSHQSIEVNGARVFLGSAEIWVPDQDRNCVYAAPDLVVHYINAHAYAPPQAFLDAVAAFIPAAWDGHAACEAMIDRVCREWAIEQGWEFDSD